MTLLLRINRYRKVQLNEVVKKLMVWQDQPAV